MHIVTNINPYYLNFVKPSPVAQSFCFDFCCIPLTHFVDTVMPGIVDELSDGQLVGQGAVRKLELVSMGYRYRHVLGPVRTTVEWVFCSDSFCNDSHMINWENWSWNFAFILNL